MKKEITFTAKQVGERVKERRTELNLTMPELGKRIGVNKSTIQRYEADGVDPKRTMIINGLAEALLPNGSQVFQKIRNMTAERFAKKTWKNISKSTLILCLRL